MLHITIDQQKYTCPKGTVLLELIRKAYPQKEKNILGCLEGGMVTELAMTLEKDHQFETITYQHEEGRRIYERSLRFVLLIAVERLFPKEKMRMLNSIGYGISGKLLDTFLTRDQISLLKEEMEKIVLEDYPFEKAIWSKEEAIAYFKEKGQKDKVDLLAYRPYDYFPIYTCAGQKEYFYGAMVPSTGWVSVFHIRPLFPGWVLQLPNPKKADQASTYTQHPKFQSVFAESQRGCNILNVENAADRNRMIAKDQVRKFIRVSESLHDRAMADVADAILQKRSRIVLIAGPSSSG